MTVKLEKLDKDSFAHWFVIAAIAKNNVFGKVENLSWDNCNIDFKINGVEIDFVDMMERIESAFNSSVDDKAKELVKDKISEIDNIFNDIREMTIGELQDKVNLERD